MTQVAIDQQAAKQEAEQRRGRPADRCAMVIFGASGDLTKRMLLPSLYHLAKKELLPKEFALVGCAIDEMSKEDYCERVRSDLKEFGGAPDKCKFCEWLLERLYYLRGDFNNPETFRQLRDLLGTVDEQHGTGGNYLYYLATTPSLFGDVVKHLGAAGLAEESDGRWRRVVFEKPFGRDLESARALNRSKLARCWPNSRFTASIIIWARRPFRTF